MRLQLTIVLPALLLLGGCATKRFYSGGYHPGTPVVRLESATVTNESPALGYPLIPFPFPIYPRDFVRAGIVGEVTVRLSIDKDGYVKEAAILASSHKEFEAPVLDATSRWRFRETPEFPPSAPKGLIIDCRIKFSNE